MPAPSPPESWPLSHLLLSGIPPPAWRGVNTRTGLPAWRGRLAWRQQAGRRSMKLAFLGLGVMGYPMAGHLAKAGHQVTVYNRTSAKGQAWVKEYGGATKATPAQAAEGAEIVFTCVGNDDDIREVAAGAQGAFAGMSRGAILADHTTASADVARELAAIAKEKGLGF